MSQQETQGSPLIDPEQVKSVVSAEAATTDSTSAPLTQTKKKKTAAELGPKEYCWGTGRRKSSVARVRIRPGSGNIVVNTHSVEEYFHHEQDRNAVRSPLKITDNVKSYDVWVNLKGGGTTGQAGAMMLGLARALIVADPGTYGILRDHRLLTRDPRMVERKKYGQKKARKSFQFSKR